MLLLKKPISVHAASLMWILGYNICTISKFSVYKSSLVFCQSKSLKFWRWRMKYYSEILILFIYIYQILGTPALLHAVCSPTRHDTTRWLMTTAPRAHHLCRSHASKKTTPQNICSKIMASVINAVERKHILNARVTQYNSQGLNTNWHLITWGYEVMLRVAMDTDGSRTQGIWEYVDHRERSAHEAKAQTWHCKTTTHT